MLTAVLTTGVVCHDYVHNDPRNYRLFAALAYEGLLGSFKEIHTPLNLAHLSVGFFTIKP